MSRSSVWSMRGRGRPAPEMPLRGYFLFVGGALLMLLLAADWMTPRPASSAHIKTEVKLPPIRIHSELKGPVAVVIDTSRPIIGPPLATQDMATLQAVASPNSPVLETVAEPTVPALHLADARELNVPQGQQPSGRKVVAARRKRRPTLRAQRPDSVSLDSGPTTLVPSGLRFREAFGQLTPSSQKIAGSGQPNSRRRMTVVYQGW